MAFTALATRVYKDPITTVYLNSLKQNDDYFITGVAKAWVVFDGSAATVTALNNLNVSNITDNGAGDYTLTFVTGFTSRNYCFVGSIGGSVGGGTGWLDNQDDTATYIATGSLRIATKSAAGTLADAGRVCVAVFGASS